MPLLTIQFLVAMCAWWKNRRLSRENVSNVHKDGGTVRDFCVIGVRGWLGVSIAARYAGCLPSGARL